MTDLANTALNDALPRPSADSSYSDAQPDPLDQALDLSMLSIDQTVDMNMLSLDQAVDMFFDATLDQDEDGFPRPQDCDDADPEVNPGIPFTCVMGASYVCSFGKSSLHHRINSTTRCRF